MTHQVPPDIVARFAALPAATIYEAAGKLGDMAPNIRPMVPGFRMAGPAFTVKSMPGDNLVVFRAIAEAPAGSVLVIDGGGTEHVTIWGGTSTVAAQMRGLAGCVTNASVRDLDEITESRFPVFAAGVAVRGTAKSHPGWIGIAVSVGGVVVRQGDIVVADADGVVVVEAEKAERVLAKAEAKRRDELDKENRLRQGGDIKTIMGF
jgi:4-hydroxy-4-methyl-2-oxoglutarate aldolase